MAGNKRKRTANIDKNPKPAKKVKVKRAVLDPPVDDEEEEGEEEDEEEEEEEEED